jgi:hypothetical protein
MANRITQAKAKSIAAEYILTGYDKRKTLLNCGYKEGYVNSKGLQNVFNNDLVKKEIEHLSKKTEIKTDVTIEEIVKELKSLAFLTADINKSDKLKALELLGKYKAMFTDKSIVSNELPPALEQREKEALEEASRQAAIKLSKTGTEG